MSDEASWDEEWCLWDSPFKCPHMDLIIASLEQEDSNPSFLDNLCAHCSLRIEYEARHVPFIT